MLKPLPDGDGAPPRPDAPLTPEEALALFQASLGDAASGLLLAVSGGPDSIAMLGLAHAIRARLPGLSVATVDHRLRPEAAAEALLVAGFCEALGIPFRKLVWQRHPGGAAGQAAAREARYALLLAHARAIGASHLATAHTLDDQAETVLMRIAGGSGIGGLAAMRASAKRGDIFHARPFLAVTKARLVAICESRGWPFARDPSNEDPRFGRVRLRALMPLIAREGLTPERLAGLAARAARMEEAVEKVTQGLIEQGAIGRAPASEAVRLEAAPFMAAPAEIATRLLARAIGLVAVRETREAPLPLGKLERLVERLRLAVRAGRPCRATLAGAMITVGPGGIDLRPAPPRRRKPGPTRPDAALSRNALASGQGVSK